MKYEVWSSWSPLPGSHAGGVFAHPTSDDAPRYHVGHTLGRGTDALRRYLGVYNTWEDAKVAHPDLIDERPK